MDFLFFIGRTHELAVAELSVVLSARFSDATAVQLSTQIVKVSGLTLEQAQSLQTVLGGTLKIAQISSILDDASTKELEDACATLLMELGKERQKIEFGIAEIGRDTLQAVDHYRVKEQLKHNGYTVRFVEGTRSGLGASVLLHQNVDECVIVRDDKQTYLGYTVAVQNIDDWSLRDRAKPAADKAHGMLPPKIARILVNLSLPAGQKGKRLLDPFCGTGTVVMEAMMVGLEGIGTDIRIEAVGQTQKNANWLNQQYQMTAPFTVAVADIAHLSPDLIKGKVDGVAAEGYLGALSPRPGAVPNIFKGLERLYLGAFKQLTKVLVPGARVAIALPRIKVKNTVYSLAPLVDRLQEHGYNSVLPPMIYDREGAITQREVFVVEFSPKS